MCVDNIRSVKKTYSEIQRLHLKLKVDSLQVIHKVEDYRQYWKPKKIHVILLAESHVYTSDSDFSYTSDSEITEMLLNRYPTNFVRFVYCLGYGENSLLGNPQLEQRNTGTPQYWKIFSSCTAESDSDLGFHRVLKTKTRNITERLLNKLEILYEMKNRGIWLVDSSIVGLYNPSKGRKDKRAGRKVIDICWRNHLKEVIKEAEPRLVIIIGKWVENILSKRLNFMKVQNITIPQPQARGSSEWQLKNYKKYQNLCSRYAP